MKNIDKMTNGNSIKDGKYLVSAIVSVYNCERFIEGCLEDLENQTIADKVEIVIVNSGSQQHEEIIISKFQDRYTNIVYLKTQERETIYAAWNRGIKAASGKYITNANADDRHRKDAIEILSNFLENNSDIDLIYPSFKITRKENDLFENYANHELYDPPYYDRYKLLFQSLPGPFPMWRKSVNETCGFFNEKYDVAGDHEFWLRISETSKFYHINEYLGLYYRNPQGGEYRNPILTKTEVVDVVNHYIDHRFMPQYHTDINLIKKIRKRQSDLSFWAADYFYFQNRPDLARKYAFKSYSYGSNYLNTLKLLLYSWLPISFVNFLRSIRKLYSVTQ
jgi:glycosyltransferase involved in cell wall biosynthesis